MFCGEGSEGNRKERVTTKITASTVNNYQSDQSVFNLKLSNRSVQIPPFPAVAAKPKVKEKQR